MGYESKVEMMKKEHNQAESQYKKQLNNLEKELEHQRQRLNL